MGILLVCVFTTKEGHNAVPPCGGGPFLDTVHSWHSEVLATKKALPSSSPSCCSSFTTVHHQPTPYGWVGVGVFTIVPSGPRTDLAVVDVVPGRGS